MLTSDKYLSNISIERKRLYAHSCTSLEFCDRNKQREFMNNCNGSLISIKRWNFIFKYNQQGARLHNLFISVKFSTCFRRFLRPSSGAQNCIYSNGYFVKPLMLPATTVAGSSKGLTKYPVLYIQF